MRPDTPVRQAEAKSTLRRALQSYEGDPRHVAIYVASRRQGWNELQTALSRTSFPSSPDRVSAVISAVERHLRSTLNTHVTGHD
jgi:hypothetical protein